MARSRYGRRVYINGKWLEVVKAIAAEDGVGVGTLGEVNEVSFADAAISGVDGSGNLNQASGPPISGCACDLALYNRQFVWSHGEPRVAKT